MSVTDYIFLKIYCTYSINIQPSDKTHAFNFEYCIIIPKIPYLVKRYVCHNNSYPDIKSARLTHGETDSLTVQSTHTP